MKNVLKRSPSEMRVMEFMRCAGQNIPDRPTVPDEKTRILRAKLILEEALETVRALGVTVNMGEPDTGHVVQVTARDATESYLADGTPDLMEIADGVADVQVVSLGTALACGIAMESVQELVDESNLAKFESPKCPNCQSAMILQYGEWKCGNYPSVHQQLPKEAGPHMREDGKYVKPPYWKKPDIEGLLRAQTEAAQEKVCGINDPGNKVATEEMLNKDYGKFPRQMKVELTYPDPRAASKELGIPFADAAQITFDVACEMLADKIFATPYDTDIIPPDYSKRFALLTAVEKLLDRLRREMPEKQDLQT